MGCPYVGPSRYLSFQTLGSLNAEEIHEETKQVEVIEVWGFTPLFLYT